MWILAILVGIVLLYLGAIIYIVVTFKPPEDPYGK